jgi:hypothetical protein
MPHARHSLFWTCFRITPNALARGISHWPVKCVERELQMEEKSPSPISSNLPSVDCNLMICKTALEASSIRIPVESPRAAGALLEISFGRSGCLELVDAVRVFHLGLSGGASSMLPPPQSAMQTTKATDDRARSGSGSHQRSRRAKKK